MLEPIKHFLNSQRIILASSSPRRKSILERNLGLNVDIVPSKFPEDLDKTKFATFAEYAVENAFQKAREVACRLQDEDWFLIIGSDTVVDLENSLYEKPADKEDAFNMLKKLRNKSHHVHTGVCLIKRNMEFARFHETSRVQMSDYSDEVIRSYVATGEPLDKAGGYGTQELGSSLVKGIHGDYFNVKGFPAHKFALELRRFLNL